MIQFMDMICYHLCTHFVGMYPLKKHLPLVVPRHNSILTRSRHNTTDHGLFLVKQDLDRQLMQGNATASNSSLFSQQSSLCVDLCSIESGGNHSSKGSEIVKSEPGKINRNLDDISKSDVKESEENKDSKFVDCKSVKEKTDSHKQSELSHQDIKSRMEGREDSSIVYEGDSRRNSECSGSSVVSDSNLLSPEAQLLTQKILLETECMSGTKNIASEAYRCKLSSDKQISNQVQSCCHDFNKPTKTRDVANHIYQPRPPSTTEKLESLDQPVENMSDDLAMHTPNRETFSEVFVASRQILKFTSAVRPQSASCIKREDQKMERNTLSSRPKSAVQVSCKQKNDSETSSTIFVDLSNIHPLHTDNTAANGNSFTDDSK